MILFHYSSMRELLQHAYPEFQWEESRFRRPKVQTPNKYWEDVSRQRDLLDSIGKDMNLKQVSSLLATPQELIPDLHKLSDWYCVSRKDVEGKGGKVLFKLHGSLHKALRAAYPEYPWRSDRFAIRERTPKAHLNSNSQLMAALDKAEKQLGIQQVPPPPKTTLFPSPKICCLKLNIDLARRLALCHSRRLKGGRVRTQDQPTPTRRAVEPPIPRSQLADRVSIEGTILPATTVGARCCIAVSGSLPPLPPT